jgi:hypothetical protein
MLALPRAACLAAILCCVAAPASPAPPAGRSIDMWWKPQNSSSLASDLASMQEIFSISGVIIYCGLAVLDNGTVGFNSDHNNWGQPALCPAAIAAAGSAGLTVQVILEGRVAGANGGVQLAYQRGGVAVGREVLRLAQSFGSGGKPPHITGVNIDFEMTRGAQWKPTEAASNEFTASLAQQLRPAALDLTLCVPGLPASRPLANGITEVFEMAEYTAGGGKPSLGHGATNWAWKLDFDLNGFANDTTAFVVGLMTGGNGGSLTAWENTTSSVGTKFALMKQRGIRKVAIFCWPGAERVWGGLLREWQSQLKAFSAGGE